MDLERLGAFYLGKEYDTRKNRLLNRPLMYDARDLTTHAVCVGMTGSGKTGLCIDLLEEAAIDRVPAVIIDPKGDISNLLLTFPDLKAADFRPWVNADDARRKGLSEEEFASRQAALWKKGLAEWGQDGERIRLLKESADFVVFTPGSDAGVPVSILQSFQSPGLDWATESELLRERIRGTVSALLGLVGIEANPLRSREHILLATIFEHFWREDADLDLPSLIMAIQAPPIRKLGVFDIDTFFPAKDRFDLAMALNSIIAAPGFQGWLKGQALDIGGFLAAPDGRCRHSIFSIAHLNDAERMFFVTMLLNELITWMRRQPGTTSLRALLYMDELFGFFPPVANPPSKEPLLTLLKQGRAFGLGAVLTTQNPVDIDYKGLSNAGTWFIGRLQTERDKDRLLDGLDSASAGSPSTLDRAALSRTISDLDSRVFLLHNVHEEAPVTFRTRWAMSYLRGPLTRLQIGELMKERRPDGAPATALQGTPLEPGGRVRQSSGESAASPPSPAGGAPPHLPPGIRQSFLPLRRSAGAAAVEIEGRGGGALETLSTNLVYRPAVLGLGTVHFVDRRRKISEEEPFALLALPSSPHGAIDWSEADRADLKGSPLSEGPEKDSSYESLPESINEIRELKALEKELEEYLYRSSTLEILSCPAVKMYSRPSESERDFRLRLQHALREARDREVDKINRRYAPRLRRLENKIVRAGEALSKKEAMAKSRKGEVLVSIGESLLGVFMGRRSTRAASTTLSKYRQSKTAAMSIGEAKQALAAARKEVAAVQEELQEKVGEIRLHWDEAEAQLEKIPIGPRRTDIDVDFFGLAWVPYWFITLRDRQGLVTRSYAPAS